MTSVSHSDDQRRAIFRTVIEAQDGGATVGQSRATAAERFGVTVEDVKAVEKEGIEKQWPPL